MIELDDRAARVRKLSGGKPEKAALIEAQSRLWMLVCPQCGFEQSFWDAGWTRYNSLGNPRWYRACAGCGKTGWIKAVWRGPVAPGQRDPNRSGTFIVKLVLAILAGVALLVGLILRVVFKLTGIL